MSPEGPGKGRLSKMLHRLTYLENRRTLGDSGTLVTDINVRDPMTALWVELRATNGATSNVANLAADCLTKIEVIDGGHTVISLNGYEAYALAGYLNARLPSCIFDETGGNVQSIAFPIQFGRWIGDSTFAFDPTKYTMPQVRVQWNLAAVRAVSATAFLTGSATLTLLAELMEGGSAPVGVLNAKEFYTFTTQGSGVEYVDLPRDYNLCGFMLRAHKDGVGWYSIISNVKLNADQGKYVPIDLRGTDYLREMMKDSNRFVYPHVYQLKDQDTLYSVLKYDEFVELNPTDSLVIAGYTGAGVGCGPVGVTRGGSSYATRTLTRAIIEGSLPFACAWTPLGDLTDPNDWFPAPSFRSLRLELTQGTSGATAAVVTRQAESY